MLYTEDIMVRRIKQKSSESLERLAVRATAWIGSTQSLFVHSFIFAGIFSLAFFGVDLQKILIVVTTLLSYEAIYLSIFIQMSVNRQARQLEDVAQDVEEIQEDVEGIEKDVDEIQEGVESIEKDVDEIQKDVDEIQEDVEEIEKEVDEISGEMTEDEKSDANKDMTLSRIEDTLKVLMTEISELKKQAKKK